MQMVEAIDSYSTSDGQRNELSFKFIDIILETKKSTIMEEYA